MNLSKLLFFLVMVAVCRSAALRGDTILQRTAQEKPLVIQRNAIVVNEDSSSLTYKHFELKERRVVKVRLEKGSLGYIVRPSGPDERQDIVGLWKKFGYKATVTDSTGKTAQLYDVYLDFYPPGGRGSLLESIGPRTSFTLSLEGGGADDIEFSKIEKIELQGGVFRVSLRTGQVETGHFLMPTSQPAEVRLLGITDQYEPSSPEVFDFSRPLNSLKEIRFD